ncbi:unnamed protein product [Effrenium voratum]|uniref:Uncharacterized protein n=1 Tax=Effrenium voratum TaxID=2562239 RepID=A0AA36J3U8_9DINO|nr:unnamed protein product [Effrenium voratum]|mmetsp:Transcript_50010/g.119423  ORF Transcript_50010/g.119423 Transcript_50010/m.119423 type:complete len:374 (-) Transcript_50010:46-1167(-)
MPLPLSLSTGSLSPSNSRMSFFDVMKSTKQKFPWEKEDMWVMGPIGDSLLKKLRAKGPEDFTLPAVPAPPMSPSSPSSPAAAASRRGKCKVVGTRCRQYDPIIFIPQSLMDGLEIANELRQVTKRLLEECASDKGNGRPEIIHGIAPFDLVFELEEPVPNGSPVFSQPAKGGLVGKFKIREERWHQEMQKAASIKPVLKRLGSLQFLCNELLLPELLAWCDQFRAVKLRRCQELAFEKAEARELLGQRRRNGQKRNTAQQDQQLMEKAALRAKKLGALAAKAVDETIDVAKEVCKCGYQEVWHESADALLSVGEFPVFEPPKVMAAKVTCKEQVPMPQTSFSFTATECPALISLARRQEKGAVLSAGRLTVAS